MVNSRDHGPEILLVTYAWARLEVLSLFQGQISLQSMQRLACIVTHLLQRRGTKRKAFEELPTSHRVAEAVPRPYLRLWVSSAHGFCLNTNVAEAFQRCHTIRVAGSVAAHGSLGPDGAHLKLTSSGVPVVLLRCLSGDSP